MRKIFQVLDKNLDGALSKEEVVAGLKKLGVKQPLQEADRIFAQADIDGDGEIRFEEWCTANMDKRKLLGQQSL